MRSSVTPVAQGDEILLCIVTEQAARLHMMNLEVTQRPAELAAPSISLQHLAAVRARICKNIDQAAPAVVWGGRSS